MNKLLGISLYNVGIEYITALNFKRVQLCHRFSGAREITSLIKLARKYPIKIVYHSPVFYQSDPRLTYYLHGNPRLREATFEILEINLRMANSLPTESIVVHFCYGDDDHTVDDETLMKLAMDSARRLNELSIKYQVPINLEYMGYNNRFYKPQEWINVISDYSNLGICLDVGHLYISSQLNNMDYYEELKTLLPATKLVHLWNTRGMEDTTKYGHIAVNPNQREEEGWIDIKKTLNEVLSYNHNIPIIFEPDFDYGDNEYVQEGIDWVNKFVYEQSKRWTDNLAQGK